MLWKLILRLEHNSYHQRIYFTVNKDCGLADKNTKVLSHIASE